MADDCFKKLGDEFSHAKPNPESIAPALPLGKVLQTRFGAITDTTGFNNKMSVARRYKAWTVKNEKAWVPKGNRPLLYEKDFLETLSPDDFTGLKTVVDKLAPEALLTGTPVYEAELVKRFAIKPGHKLYEAEVTAKRVTDAASARGLRVDTTVFQSQLEEASKEMGRLERKIHADLGSFRINSNEELGQKLKERGFKPPSTRGGNVEVSADVLTEAGKTDTVFNDIVEFKQKQRNVGVLKRLMSESKGGRIHTTYDQLKTPTGRIQSEAPNLKNLTPELRKGIIADPGKVFLEADYAQEEMRIIAGQADVKVWKDAFKAGVDTHSATASEMFGVPLEAVTPEMRKAAKIINLGQMYGQTAFRVAQQLGVTEERATELMKKFHSAVPELKKFAAEVGKKAMKDGYVSTLDGRIRDLSSEIEADFDKAMRQAINMRGQGGAADLLKTVMKDLEPLEKKGIEMAHFIDDAVLFQVPEGMNLETAKAMIRERMEKTLSGVKMKVEFKSGKSFGDMKSIEKLEVEASKPIPTNKPVQEGSRVFAAKFKSEKVVEELKFGGDGHANPVSMVRTDKGGRYVKKLVDDSEITMEEVYHDIAKELGSDIVPPAVRVGKNTMVSEFVSKGKSMSDWLTPSRAGRSMYERIDPKPMEQLGKDLQKALSKHVKTTKEGSDFIFMDHVLNQVDRNAGNMIIDFDVSTKTVNGIKLIDNGASFVPGSANSNRAISAALGDVEYFKLHAETIEGVKTWLKRFGWDEALVPGTVDHSVMWNRMGSKIEDFLGRYKWSEGVVGDRSATKEAVWRIQNIVDSDFNLSVKQWVKAPVQRTKL